MVRPEHVGWRSFTHHADSKNAWEILQKGPIRKRRRATVGSLRVESQNFATWNWRFQPLVRKNQATAKTPNLASFYFQLLPSESCSSDEIIEISDHVVNKMCSTPDLHELKLQLCTQQLVDSTDTLFRFGKTFILRNEVWTCSLQVYKNSKNFKKWMPWAISVFQLDAWFWSDNGIWSNYKLFSFFCINLYNVIILQLLCGKKTKFIRAVLLSFLQKKWRKMTFLRAIEVYQVSGSVKKWQKMTFALWKKQRLLQMHSSMYA